MSDALVTAMDQMVEQAVTRNQDGDKECPESMSPATTTTPEPQEKKQRLADPPHTTLGARVESATKLLRAIIESNSKLLPGVSQDCRFTADTSTSFEPRVIISSPAQVQTLNTPAAFSCNSDISSNSLGCLIASLSDAELSAMLYSVSINHPDLVSLLFFREGGGREPSNHLSPLVAYLLTSRFEKLLERDKDHQSPPLPEKGLAGDSGPPSASNTGIFILYFTAALANPSSSEGRPFLLSQRALLSGVLRSRAKASNPPRP